MPVAFSLLANEYSQYRLNPVPYLLTLTSVNLWLADDDVKIASFSC